MAELPTGTVTFLFTDIEGSTKLLDELGAEGYAEALAEHRRVMREAFSTAGGVEVDTQGDAFFVAFPAAREALAAAEQAQAAHAEGPIRVRMGIHSGQPLLTEQGYVGIDVHRGARVMSAGHGGQVLVSHATYALLDGEGELIDLGRHRLKDLTEPQPLYQLGQGEFPPLKTLYQTNLPVQPTPLVGRERELGEVLELLASSRIVTMTGAGGSGKTRLALQAAAELVDEFKDGVWWVSLAALREPELVEPTIAQVVGAEDGLAEHLRTKQALLLLDNFEQLLPAAPAIAELLTEAPVLRVLVTSRERLAIAAETEYAVPTLVPAEAVALFTARARQLKREFEPDEHVEEICRRLDGLPLALELAAARVKVLRLEQILERLGKSLELLGAGARDAPERQRTLRATIDWSYDLLSDDEKEVFRRLAVFAGSFDLEAAEEVCDPDLDALASLVDKSLLRQTVEGRFFMLETIHEYAVERLDEDDAAAELRRRHAERTLRVAEAARARYHQGYEVLEAEHDNARAALDFLAEAAEPELALRLAIAFGDFWYVRGHIREGDQRMQAVVAEAAVAPAELRVVALARAASLARSVGDADRAERDATAALELAQALGDHVAVAAALRELGEAMMVRKDYRRAFSLYEEALAVGGEAGEVPALTNLADVALAAGELERTIAYSAEAAAAAELANGPDAETTKAIAAFNTASALIQLGRGSEASSHLRDALETVVRIDYPDVIGWCLVGSAALAAEVEPRDAATLLGTAEAVESAGAALGPAEEKLREWTLALLREQLGPAELQEGLQAGRALPMRDGVSLARKYLD
jgi:predicted ATPase